MAVELVAPAEELSQGDLFTGAPSVWLESLNPMIQVDSNRYELRRTFVGSHRPGTKHKANASEVRVVGAVLSHDCELDKATTSATVLVGLVRRLVDVRDDQVRDGIRANAHLRALYLPPSPLLTDRVLRGVTPDEEDDNELGEAGMEAYVDFRRVTTLTRATADQLEIAASLNEDGKALLQAQLFRFLSRRVLPPEWTDWEVELEA